LDQYSKDNGIEPTEAEIKTFIDSLESLSALRLREAELKKSRLEKDLESLSGQSRRNGFLEIFYR
jgi:hypothetical protein